MRSSGSGKKQNFFWRHFNGIAMAAIVLIPTIYTTLFLGSMWDPYGNVDQLPVAVVNNDKSVDYEGKELAVGDELVDKLRENDQLERELRTAHIIWSSPFRKTSRKTPPR